MEEFKISKLPAELPMGLCEMGGIMLQSDSIPSGDFSSNSKATNENPMTLL